MGACTSDANLVDHIEQHTHEKQIQQIEENEQRKESLQNKISILTVATQKINKYKQEMSELRALNTELNEMNGELKDCINDKNTELSQNSQDITAMQVKIKKLEKEAFARKECDSINDILYKIAGDTVNKLKYSKMSAKFVTFIADINNLFYYNNNSHKSETKCIIIRDIIIANNAIQKQLNKPWFLIIGTKRKALFVCESIQTRDKWHAFICRSLKKNTQTQTVIQKPTRTRAQTVSNTNAYMKLKPKNSKTKTKNISKFEYKSFSFIYPQSINNCMISNNGCNVIVHLQTDKCHLKYGNETYALDQFYFSLNSKQNEMEMHLVHRNRVINKVIVLCLIYTTNANDSGNSESESEDSETETDFGGLRDLPDLGASNNQRSNEFLAQFWNDLPLKKTKDSIPLKRTLAFESLFRELGNRDYSIDSDSSDESEGFEMNLKCFEYSGPLGVPPYTKSVNWFVTKKRHFLNYKQLTKLKKIWYTYL